MFGVEDDNQLLGLVLLLVFGIGLAIAIFRNVIWPRRSDIEIQVLKNLASFFLDVSATLFALALAGFAVGSIDSIAFDWETNGLALIYMSLMGLVASIVLSYLNRRAPTP